jgi:hypothetical protein
VEAPHVVGGYFEVETGADYTAPACSSTNVLSQSFPKRKTVKSTCLALSMQQSTCSSQFVVPEPNAFPCRRLTSYCVLKRQL